MESLLAAFGQRVVSVTRVHGTTSTQLLPLGAAVRAFLAWCKQHRPEGYHAVVVTRFDVLIKTDLHALMGDAHLMDGFRLLWREAGGHWRHHSDARTSAKTFLTAPRMDWRASNPRAPDALIAFPYAYTRCFLASTRKRGSVVSKQVRHPTDFTTKVITTTVHNGNSIQRKHTYVKCRRSGRAARTLNRCHDQCRVCCAHRRDARGKEEELRRARGEETAESPKIYALSPSAQRPSCAPIQRADRRAGPGPPAFAPA